MGRAKGNAVKPFALEEEDFEQELEAAEKEMQNAEVNRTGGEF